MHLTHNKSIKTLTDVAHHLDLEEDHIEALRLNTDVYMTDLSSHDASRHK